MSLTEELNFERLNEKSILLVKLFSQKQTPSICIRCDDIFYADLYLRYLLENFENKSYSKIYNSNDFFFGSEGGLSMHGPEGELKIDEVRRIIEFSYFKKESLKKKYIVINRIERANNISENGLLKILEEPGEDTVIIALCKRYDNLLPTIKSRLLKVEVPLDLRFLENEDNLIPEILWISRKDFKFYYFSKKAGFPKINDFFQEVKELKILDLAKGYSDTCSDIIGKESGTLEGIENFYIRKEIYAFLVAERFMDILTTDAQIRDLYAFFEISSDYSKYGSSGQFYSLWFKSVIEKIQLILYEILLMNNTALWKEILYPSIKIKLVSKDNFLKYDEIKDFFLWAEKVKGFEQLIINPELTFFCLLKKLEKIKKH